MSLRKVYKLLEGNVWNPLLKYPRNSPCYCGSGRKAKKCCLPSATPYCKKSDAPTLEAIVREAVG